MASSRELGLLQALGTPASHAPPGPAHTCALWTVDCSAYSSQSAASTEWGTRVSPAGHIPLGTRLRDVVVGKRKYRSSWWERRQGEDEGGPSAGPPPPLPPELACGSCQRLRLAAVGDIVPSRQLAAYPSQCDSAGTSGGRARQAYASDRPTAAFPTGVSGFRSPLPARKVPSVHLAHVSPSALGASCPGRHAETTQRRDPPEGHPSLGRSPPGAPCPPLAVQPAPAQLLALLPGGRPCPGPASAHNPFRL